MNKGGDQEEEEEEREDGENIVLSYARKLATSDVGDVILVIRKPLRQVQL